jgi:hypothetical protein
MRKTLAAVLAAYAAAALVAGCGSDDTRTLVELDSVTVIQTDTIRIGNTLVVFDQIDRLGNPLVAEVFIEKREHGHFNVTGPSEDVAQFRGELASFVVTVAGRNASYADSIAAALTPDLLLVRLDKTGGGPFGANVGWLSYVTNPANGYGGRKLQGDDAVDKALSAIFGNALGNNSNVSPGLVTDNVGANDRAPSATFPYLAGPN